MKITHEQDKIIAIVENINPINSLFVASSAVKKYIDECNYKVTGYSCQSGLEAYRTFSDLTGKDTFLGKNINVDFNMNTNEFRLKFHLETIRFKEVPNESYSGGLLSWDKDGESFTRWDILIKGKMYNRFKKSPPGLRYSYDIFIKYKDEAHSEMFDKNGCMELDLTQYT